MTALVIAGFLLGVGGSAHCLVMCGPLVLLAHGARLRAGAADRTPRIWRIAPHHLARVGVYSTLGLAAGASGRIVSGLGLERALAVVSGAALIAAALGWIKLGSAPAKLGQWLSRSAARLVGPVRDSPGQRLAASLMLGVANGLLPCGLLYAALVAAAGSGSAVSGAAFMAAFGLGSVPALAILAVSAHAFRARAPLAARRAAPIALALVGGLLVLRGVVPHFGMMHHASGQADMSMPGMR